jgi:hypothetical protein
MRVLGDSSRVGHAGFASSPPLSGPSNCDFALSNGVFARVFPLAPASAAYVGLGAVILGSGVLHRTFGYVAVGLGLANEGYRPGVALGDTAATGVALGAVALGVGFVRRAAAGGDPLATGEAVVDALALTVGVALVVGVVVGLGVGVRVGLGVGVRVGVGVSRGVGVGVSVGLGVGLGGTGVGLVRGAMLGLGAGGCVGALTRP